MNVDPCDISLSAIQHPLRTDYLYTFCRVEVLSLPLPLPLPPPPPFSLSLSLSLSPAPPPPPPPPPSLYIRSVNISHVSILDPHHHFVNSTGWSARPWQLLSVSHRIVLLAAQCIYIYICPIWMHGTPPAHGGQKTVACTSTTLHVTFLTSPAYICLQVLYTIWRSITSYSMSW